MTLIKTNRELWGKDFPIGGEWDAGCTPPHTPSENSGRWTVRREATRFVVFFHPFRGHPEVFLAEYPATDQGEIDAKTCALHAREIKQIQPISLSGA